MKTKKILMFSFGLVCALIGIIILLMNVSITSWSFYRFGRISTGGILFVILILSIIYWIASKNKLGMYLTIGTIALMLLSLILGINMYIRHISAFNMILIVGLIAVGIGLIIKSLIN